MIKKKKRIGVLVKEFDPPTNVCNCEGMVKAIALINALQTIALLRLANVHLLDEFLNDKDIQCVVKGMEAADRIQILL